MVKTIYITDQLIYVVISKVLEQGGEVLRQKGLDTLQTTYLFSAFLSI